MVVDQIVQPQSKIAMQGRGLTRSFNASLWAPHGHAIAGFSPAMAAAEANVFDGFRVSTLYAERSAGGLAL
jgi:hypothetical protein